MKKRAKAASDLDCSSPAFAAHCLLVSAEGNLEAAQQAWKKADDSGVVAHVDAALAGLRLARRKLP